MPFITQGKTNWKFFLIVIILAIIVGGGALWYAKRPEKPYQTVEIKKQENKEKIFIAVNDFSDATQVITYYLNQYPSPNESNVLNKLVAQFPEEYKKLWKVNDQNIVQWIEESDLNNDGIIELMVGYVDPFIFAGEEPPMYGFPYFFSIFTKEGNLYKKIFDFSDFTGTFYYGMDNPSIRDINYDNKLELAINMYYFTFHTGEKVKEVFRIQWNGQKWVNLTLEDECIITGGTVTTSLCCKSSGDFPDSCRIGACGCSLDNSNQVKTCDCGKWKCFNGETCQDEGMPGP